MLKLGICNPAQDTPTGRWWRRGLLAASMLATGTPASREELDRFERIIAKLRLSNGTVKTTARNRLAAVDEAIASLLPKMFPADTPLSVEDWAVSSGITAAEWFRSLRRMYANVSFSASDWLLYLIEARRPQEGDSFIVEPDGVAIEYIRPPFVVSLTEMQHPIYFVNRAVQRQGMRNWKNVARHFRVPADDEVQTTSGPLVLRRLPLIHPEVMQLQSEGFRIRQHSVFAKLSQPVDVIRTMNILNLAYFTEAQLRSAVEAVRQSLRPGGLWIVGRTVTDNPAVHEVSVLQSTSAGWEPLLRIGNGSEVEALLRSRDPALSHA